ncbi:MAG: glutamine--fructose-6-phosphate transaminase (isomerizing) [Thaumarchaeota archaeon]|nr:glutamine--fructose-6-phosphate transaminase (isomerizing) [Nitrososphaerota archaeon]
MCSIIGYMGSRDAAPLLVRALRRMEYRGYDSAGIATVSEGRIVVSKGVGKVEQVNTSKQLDGLPGSIGIGHTRWATHGGVSEANAHPHLSWSGKIAIVHNGIIENYEQLKAEVGQRGYLFRSQTDSEVIANVLQCNRDLGMTVEESVSETLRELKGRYAFVALMDDGTLVGARNHAPLILGMGRNGVFVSSDIMGFVEEADQVIYLDNGQFVWIGPQTIRVSDFGGTPVEHHLVRVSNELGDATKGDYVHYTLKEIHDQPMAITKAGARSKTELGILAAMIRQADVIYITGSGSSYNAALVGKHLFSQYAGIRMEPIISSEAQFSPMNLDQRSILLALSQSGESADVLEAATIARERGATVASLVNVETSSLARLSAISVGLNCGPEIGVAATKSFTSQLAVLYALNDIVCGGNDFDMQSVPGEMAKIFADDESIRRLSKELKDVPDIYVLGDGVHYFIACEASLKLKELAYIHAEAMPSGELKHGPLALLDSSSYVLVFNPSDATHSNTLASAHEVKARGAKIIGVSDQPNGVYDHWIRIPRVPEQLFAILEILPIQLLAYHIALQRNTNPDYPRNLAKSVTVS